MTFSIIIPTMGRPTLGRTLDSIIHQMGEKDEIIVVTDGPMPHVFDLVKHYVDVMPAGRITVTTGPETHDNGGTQRDLGISMAQSDWLLFMDDDDIYTRSAFNTVRQALSEFPGPELPHVFKMQAGGGGGWQTQVVGWTGTLWQQPKLTYGNVGTPMFVVSKLTELPKWANYHKNSHDFGFIHEIVTKYYDNQMVWRPEVISIIRPSGEDLEREIPNNV